MLYWRRALAVLWVALSWCGCLACTFCGAKSTPRCRAFRIGERRKDARAEIAIVSWYIAARRSSAGRGGAEQAETARMELHTIQCGSKHLVKARRSTFVCEPLVELICASARSPTLYFFAKAVDAAHILLDVAHTFELEAAHRTWRDQELREGAQDQRGVISLSARCHREGRGASLLQTLGKTVPASFMQARRRRRPRRGACVSQQPSSRRARAASTSKTPFVLPPGVTASARAFADTPRPRP